MLRAHGETAGSNHRLRRANPWNEKGKTRGDRDQRLRLWRARFSSLRFLCLRIFLRRFLMTLPTREPHLRSCRAIATPRVERGGDGYFVALAKSTLAQCCSRSVRLAPRRKCRVRTHARVAFG